MKNKIDNVIIPMNPEGINYLGYFMSDAGNLRSYAGSLLGSDVDLNNPTTQQLKLAADIALKELEDDIAKLKEFLAAYVPTTKSIDK